MVSADQKGARPQGQNVKNGPAKSGEIRGPQVNNASFSHVHAGRRPGVR